MKYESIRNKASVRFETSDLPQKGDEITLTDGSRVKYVGRGIAGMLLVEDDKGWEHLVFPFQVREAL